MPRVAHLGLWVSVLLLVVPAIGVLGAPLASLPSDPAHLVNGVRPALPPPASLARSLGAASGGHAVATVSLCNGTRIPGLARPECGLNGPSSILYDSFADRLFVSNNETVQVPSYVSVVNATTLAYEGAIPTPGPSASLDYDPVTGNLYVPTGAAGAGAIVVVNATNGDRVARFPAVVPYAIAVDPVAGLMFVADIGTIGLAIRNLTTGAAVANVSVPGALAVTFDPTDHEVFAAGPSNSSGGEVVAVDESNDSVVATHPVPGIPTALVWDARTDRVYVTESDDTISVFTGGSADYWGNVSTPGVPNSVAVDPRNGTLYVPESGTNELSLLPENSTVLADNVSLRQKVDPVSVAFDPANGSIVTVDQISPEWESWYSGALTLVSATNSSLVTTLSSYAPLGVTYNPVGGELVLPDQYGCDAVRVTLPSLGTVRFSEPGCGASLAVYDPANGSYLIPGANGTLAVVNAGSEGTEAVLSVDTNITAGLYVAAYGKVYLSGASSVLVLNATTLNVTTTFGAACGASSAMGYDPTDELLYVACQGELIAYSPTNDSAVHSIPLDNAVNSMAYDPATGRLFVSERTGDEVAVVDGRNGTLVTTIPSIGSPTGMVDDARTGLLYVAASSNGTVEEVQPSTARVLAAIPAGSWPYGLSFGANDSQLFVSDAESAALVVLDLGGNGTPTEFPVRFVETGLQNGTNWSATVGGVPFSTSSTEISLNEPNGSYPYSIGVVAGYRPQTPNGTLTVNGNGTNVSVPFARVAGARYAIVFEESGLPNGTEWAVILNGSLASSSESNLTIEAPNGSYGFRVPAVGALDPSPTNGTLVVNGSGLSRTILFTRPGPARYPVTFSETGFPAGDSWGVYLNGSSRPATGTRVVFNLTNGTYAYVIETVFGVVPTPASGTIGVVGEPVEIPITFVVLQLPELSVNEVGLPAGTVWLLVLNRSNDVAKGTSLNLTEPAGTYNFSASAPGFSASPGSGQVTLSTNRTWLNITFSREASTPAVPLFGILLAGAGAGVLVVAAAWVWVRRRDGRRARPADRVPDSDGQTSPNPPTDPDGEPVPTSSIGSFVAGG